MEDNAFTTPEIYDQLALRMIPYNEVAALVQKKVNRYLPGATNLLDAACGTGNLTLELARLGYRTSAFDNSPEMLVQAQQKTLAAKLDISYFQHNMAEPFPVGPFEVITCFYTALNYLTSPELLYRCIEAVFAALKPNGLFIFDQFTPAKMKRLFNGMDGGDLGNLYIITKSKFDEAGQISHEITYFVKQEDGSYHRLDESQHLRIHTFEEIEEGLSRAGFKLLEAEEMYPAEISYRGFREGHLFVARKPE